MRRVALVTAAVVVALCGGTAAAGTGAHIAGTARGGFLKPVHGAWISQGFGCTSFSAEPVDSACPGGHWHSGVDLAVAEGTPVYATLAGVAYVTVSFWGFGLHIVLDHGGGLTSLYGHLSAVSAIAGQYVQAGEVIGAVGSTGNSTGPHLHFEIRRDGVPEDPRIDLQLP